MFVKFNVFKKHKLRSVLNGKTCFVEEEYDPVFTSMWLDECHLIVLDVKVDQL